MRRASWLALLASVAWAAYKGMDFTIVAPCRPAGGLGVSRVTAGLLAPGSWARAAFPKLFAPVALEARPRRLQLRGQPRDRNAPHRVPFSPRLRRTVTISSLSRKTGAVKLTKLRAIDRDSGLTHSRAAMAADSVSFLDCAKVHAAKSIKFKALPRCARRFDPVGRRGFRAKSILQ